MFYEQHRTEFHNKTITYRDAFEPKNRTLKSQHNTGWEGLKESSKFSTQLEREGSKSAIKLLIQK